MVRAQSRGAYAIVTRATCLVTKQAVIDDRNNGNGKTGRCMTSLTREVGRNMGWGLAQRKHVVMTRFAIGGQCFENAAYMTCCTIQQIMIAVQRETCDEVVKFG